MTNVLVVAAHPDDEILGVGGTIARHAASGDEVHTLILAQGAAARGGNNADIDQLQDSAKRAAAILGAKPPLFAGFPDNRLDSVPLLDIVQRVEIQLAELEPTIVYTHASGDLNIDHQLTHRAVVTACRPLPESITKAIYAFETVSSTEWGERSFCPTFFVDITPFLDLKIQALHCYGAEMRAAPHPRSQTNIEALAHVRGASVGLHGAEAFEVIRFVKD